MQKTTRPNLVRQNLQLVKQLYPAPQRGSLRALRDLTQSLRLSVSQGEILWIDGKSYVTHAGLLRIAQRRRCCGIKSVLQERLSDPVTNRGIFKATVYKSPCSKGFVGYGDADPSNVSPLVRGAEMRIAETRAVNRALRQCSVPETGGFPYRGWRHLKPAILAVGPFSLSPIELGLPYGRSQPVPGASASESVPFRPSARGERRAGLSFSPSSLTRPNLIPPPRTNASRHLTMLSA